MIWQAQVMYQPCHGGQVPGVTPNETRDPDGTGRIVKFGPDRVEACEMWRLLQLNMGNQEV